MTKTISARLNKNYIYHGHGNFSWDSVQQKARLQKSDFIERFVKTFPFSYGSLLFRSFTDKGRSDTIPSQPRNP